MGIFFWDFNDFNDTARQWICFILNSLVFGFSIIALYRILQFNKKITFEVVPLAFNIASTLVLLTLKLFQKGYQFDLIGYLIEIFTYFLFAFTFAFILLKVGKDKKGGNKKMKQFFVLWFGRFYILSFVIAVVILVALILMVSIKVIDKNCDGNMVVVSLITLIFEVFTYVPALLNGKKIIKLLKQQKQSTLTQTMLSADLQSQKSLSDQFTIERRRQIFLVLSVYTLSVFIRVFLLIVSFAVKDSDLIVCTRLDEGIFIITSDYVFGQFVLILIQINQLLPHVIIPLALFVVPMKAKTKKHALVIEKSTQFSTQSDDQQDFMETRNQVIKSRVSSVFSDKADSPRRR